MEAANNNTDAQTLTDLQEVQAHFRKQLKELEEKLKKQGMDLAKAQAQTSILETLKTSLAAIPGTKQLVDINLNLQASRSSTADLIRQLKRTTSEIPQQVQAQVTHRFEGRLKGMVITILIAIFIAALSVSRWIGTARENDRLQAQDWKYRYLVGTMPSVTLSADTNYSKNPEKFREYVRSQELYREQKREAEADLKQKQKEVNEAAQKVNQLGK